MQSLPHFNGLSMSAHVLKKIHNGEAPMCEVNSEFHCLFRAHVIPGSSNASESDGSALLFLESFP